MLKDSRLGRGARHALLARRQLLELRLGQQRHLQDPARAGSLRHRVQRGRRSSVQKKPPPLNTPLLAHLDLIADSVGSVVLFMLNDNKRDDLYLNTDRLDPGFKGHAPSDTVSDVRPRKRIHRTFINSFFAKGIHNHLPDISCC